jgi:serine/threonine-protein kinase
VNDVLRASIQHLPRVSLREGKEADQTPVHRPFGLPQALPAGERRWPEQVGPYQIAGEIARGGMGTILKARDTDLGRDVALKVLHAEHQDNPDVLRRFIEEAQIASQLQHPGIVAVHGMGLLSDGLPFFVMKLVKGRTLAAILEERRDPREERQRLLGSFEQVCQALAYAHARRVVHRDLKPSNVMIGSFGEVQVMDWGLAKVLPREKLPVQVGTPEPRSIIATIRSGSGSSQSLAGSVLGTPAYMAPEQARGELDQVDARSDVFGLGAILCEILTGKAPYTGLSLEEIYNKARKGYLDEAFARLAGCGAAEELVALTRRCLAFEPRERPADASSIAKEVKAHLDSLEERTRRLAIEEVEARALAREERRSRRLTLLAGAALAALLASAGLGWITFQTARDRQEAGAARLARAGLEEAQRLLGAAQSNAQGDPAPWEAAVGAAVEAVARAGAVTRGSFTADARQHLEKARAAAAQARAAWEREERRRRLLAGLQAVRHGRSSSAEVNAGYRRAFREFGVDAESGPGEESVRLLRESGAEAEIALGLSSWAWKLHDALTERSGGWKRILELSEAVDPDPLRVRLRRAWLLRRSQDVPELYRLVAEARKQEFSLETVVLLAERVSERGNPARGFRLLQDALSRAADDLSVHDGMTVYAGDWGDLRLPHRMAKVALAPDSAEMLTSLCHYYSFDVDKPAEAAPWAEEAMRLRPVSSDLVANLGSITAELRGARSGQALFREALRLNPYDSTTWNNYAITLDNTGDPEASIQGLRASLRIERGDVTIWNLGYALQRVGDQDGALAAWAEALSRGIGRSDAHEAIGTLLFQRGEFAAAEHHLRRQLRRVATNFSYYRLGMCEWAQGRRAEAIADLGRAFRFHPVAEAANGMGDAIAALSTFQLPPRDDPSFNALAESLRGLAEGLEEASMEGRQVAWQFRGILLRAREALLEPLAPEAALAEATGTVQRLGERIPDLRALEAFARWKNGEKRRAMRILEEVLRTMNGALHIRQRLEALRASVRPELLTFASIDAALEDPVPLVRAGERWRYFPGMREPSKGDEWTRPEFDDSRWSEGPSGFGYGDSDDATELRDMAGKYTSVYLLRRLTLPEPPAGRVELRVVSDDGFVSYVNGRETGRFRAGPAGSGLTPFSRATDIHEANPLTPDVLVVTPLLRAGENLIAIQGLNDSLSSSDFSLIPEIYLVPEKDPSRDQKLLNELRAVASGEDAGARVAYLEARLAERAGKPMEALAAYERAAAATARDPEPLERVIATLDALGRGGEVRPRLESAFGAGTTASRSLLDRWLEPVEGASRSLSALLAAWPLKAQPYEIVLAPRSSPPPAERWRFTEARPPEGWERARFDDSAWTEALAPFGTGDPVQARSGFVVNTPWRTPDLWIRRRVTVDLPPSLLQHLRLSVAVRACHDDDAEVYLNGVEIARFEDWSHYQYREEEYRGALPLLPGENLVAAHCHNLKVGGALDVELVLKIMTAE